MPRKEKVEQYLHEQWREHGSAVRIIRHLREQFGWSPHAIAMAFRGAFGFGYSGARLVTCWRAGLTLAEETALDAELKRAIERGLSGLGEEDED